MRKFLTFKIEKKIYNKNGKNFNGKLLVLMGNNYFRLALILVCLQKGLQFTETTEKFSNAKHMKVQIQNS